MPKKKPSRSSVTPSRTPDVLISALVDVDGLVRGKRWADARALLEELNRRYPGRRDVLSLLAHVAIEQKDVVAQADYLQRLSRVVPNDPSIVLALGESYARADFPFLATREFRRFLERWPEDKDAKEVRKLLAVAEPELDASQRELGQEGPEGFETGAMLDETRFLIARGQYQRARQVAEQAARRLPTQPAIQNHLSLIALQEGNLDQAIRHARQALALDPENVHALANLTMLLARLGRFEEAREVADRMVALKPDRPDAWVKEAEALSYLGDDEGVLAAYERARAANALDDSANGFLLDHLVAVASARLGRVGEARFHWGRAQKVSSNNQLVEENLADLKAPVGERHGAWPFELPNWVHPRTVEELARLATRAGPGGNQALGNALRRFLVQRPEVGRVAPALLDRGSPGARELVLHLAAVAPTPELLDALRGFVRGQRGTDADRLKAMGVLREASAIGAEPLSLWQEGEWREIVPMSFEITGEAVQRHGPEVHDLAAEALAALQENRPSAALPLLRQALDLEPNAPDLLNNLAMAQVLLGHQDEADALVRQIAREHPDYFFGQVGLAQLEARAKRTEEAHRILDPLATRARFHRSEFAGLCLAEVELLLAENNPEGARSWLDLLASVAPDHPSIPGLRKVIERAQKQVVQIRGGG